jgi:hypothetical protein
MRKRPLTPRFCRSSVDQRLSNDLSLAGKATREATNAAALNSLRTIPHGARHSPAQVASVPNPQPCCQELIVCDKMPAMISVQERQEQHSKGITMPAALHGGVPDINAAQSYSAWARWVLASRTQFLLARAPCYACHDAQRRHAPDCTAATSVYAGSGNPSHLTPDIPCVIWSARTASTANCGGSGPGRRQSVRSQEAALRSCTCSLPERRNRTVRTQPRPRARPRASSGVLSARYACPRVLKRAPSQRKSSPVGRERR